MKIKYLLLIGFLSSVFCFASCIDDEENEEFVGIENISFENYPKVDGSTSSSVLNMMVACKLLGTSYRWMEPGIMSEWTLHPVYDELPEDRKSVV